MNKRHPSVAGLFFLWACSATFSSCTKNDTTSPEYMGKVVPVGKIVGTKVEKEIACSGRQISPDDGTLLIAIPARAVATATPFSIQRLSNTSTGAVGEAYRLLPHGGNFQKSIKFTYNALTTLSFCRNKT